jgi:lysophospholipase L1-like esterase
VINSQSMSQLTRIAVVGVLLPFVACGGRTTLGTDSEAEPATRANLSEGCPIFRAPTSDCKRRRVWTLGDSLTYGTDGSIPPASYVGWRLGLDGWIQRNGFDVQLIGTLSQGSAASPVALVQPRTDGHPGFTIADLSTQVGAVYGKKAETSHADLVLLLAGTNDMGFARPGATAYDPIATPAAYLALLEKIASVDERTTIVVSTIPPIEPSYEAGVPAANVIDFNRKLPALWDEFNSRRRVKVIRWDAFAELSPWSPAHFGKNPVHPNAAGYSRLWRGLSAVLRPL